MAFNLANCPTGWYPLTDMDANASGAFIRNIGDKTAARGVVQLDAVPNITGEFSSTDEYKYYSQDNMVDYWGVFKKLNTTKDHSVQFEVAGSRGTGGSVFSFDASLSSKSYGRKDSEGNPATEVRPKNIAFLYCVKGNHTNN